MIKPGDRLLIIRNYPEVEIAKVISVTAKTFSYTLEKYKGTGYAYEYSSLISELDKPGPAVIKTLKPGVARVYVETLVNVKKAELERFEARAKMACASIACFIDYEGE